MQKFPYTM